MEHQRIRRIDFTKMSGAGNDFVVIDNRARVITEPAALALSICDRRRGVGADGLLLLEESDEADFQMKYYNADGSYGGMCGNGGRCVARFALLKGIVASSELKFEALDYIYNASIAENNVRLMMKPPSDMRWNQQLQVAGVTVLFHFVDTGSPHSVVFLEQNKEVPKTLRDVDVHRLGREIRDHKYFLPHGTNVNFVERVDLNVIRTRTYERGVEAETLACGTGIVASALIANEIMGVPSPATVHTQGGEALQVGFRKIRKAEYEDVSLYGSAHVTFNGVVNCDMSTHTVIDHP
jgi:diaminopimelate epimerase